MSIIQYFRNASLTKMAMPFAIRKPVKVKSLYGNGPAAYSILYVEEVTSRDGALSMCK